MSGKIYVNFDKIHVAVRAVFLIGIVSFSQQVNAQTLWAENAENGLTNIIDGTSSSYSLIQSGLLSQGSYAFHLANPGFQDNWFVLDQDLAIQSDTKLFFQSRLSWATTSQVAKVEVSTNGGSSWLTDIFSQSGTDGAGEGGFGLREVDLSSYANQNLRFRFMYDFTGGSAFTQTNVGTGWHIDDIQIGSQLAKTLYSIGNPSADAQLYLEYINRARADALVEANRFAGETDPDIVSAYNFFGINTQDIVSQFTWSVNNGVIDQVAQPLAFNKNLNTAAELHTQDMFNNQFQGHNSSSNPPAPFSVGFSLSDRVNAVGYNWQGLAENVFSSADSARQGHAGFDVDWGNVNNPSSPNYNPAFVGQGMQNPAGHRNSIHNDSFKEIGIGVVNGTNGSVGPQLVTQDFGNPGDTTLITGVVFEDLDGNNFYDIGEGRSGVRVDVNGSGFFAISSDSGGYAVPVSGDGAYDVMFSGEGFADFVAVANVAGGKNVKIDYLTMSILFTADYNGDGDVDADDLATFENGYGINSSGDTDTDGDTDGADFLAWQRQYTGSQTLLANVPEPSSAGLLVMGLAMLSRRGRRH